MRRKPTSKKRKSYMKEGKDYVVLPSGVRAYKWSPMKEALNEEWLANALFACLKEGDADAFKEILTGYLDIKVKNRVAKINGLSPRTMYEALSEKGNPSLKTIAKLVKMACAS